ncbi:unnamed protein product [Knipowitschia caucasica]|uniref:L1 transposable element RRM domain-containing protein n=1 Tax=Knipowitschia caucasica TaxID=637954 RepID=A0AAV2KTL2_KNICA
MSTRREQGLGKKQEAGNSKSSARLSAPELTEELAVLIKTTLADEMTFHENASKLIKDSIKESLAPIEKTLTENSNILRSLSEQMDTHAKKFTTVFNKVDSIQANLRKNETDTARCWEEIKKLRENLTEQEDRARRNNVRLVNLPTGAEGGDPRGYIQKMLPTWIPSLRGSQVEIDRAHRIYSNSTTKTQTMIFRLLRYTDRQAILEGARKAKPSLPAGTPLWFYADYSTATSKRRREYNDVRARLRKKGIETFLVYPATLKVKYKGRKMSFETPGQAEEALAAALREDGEGERLEEQHVDSDSG